MNFADRARDWLEYVRYTDDEGFGIADEAPAELHRTLDELAIGEQDAIRGRFFVDAITVVDEYDLSVKEARAQAGEHLGDALPDLLGQYIQKRMQDDPNYFEAFQNEFASNRNESLSETARRVMATERKGVLTALSNYYENEFETKQNEVTEHE